MTRDGSPIRVLIVENDRDAATTLAMLLKLRGYEVEIVLDSTECLPHLESFQPDVILLDIGMPKVSGYDLAKSIRGQRRFDHVGIIAISGYGNREYKARSLESGCDQHLVKPVDLDTLEAAIESESNVKQTRPPRGAGARPQ
jgi:DNA-binding response OmpR family regulator